MNERWVVNASPVIALARVGRGGWLAQLANEVVLPEAVADEVRAGPPDPARELVDSGQLPIVKVPQAPPEIADWALGAGESAVLTWALQHPGWTAILDDLPARRCARSLALPLKGTLAIVILARQRGLTDSAAATIRKLQRIGLRLDETLVRKALAATVGETWP